MMQKFIRFYNPDGSRRIRSKSYNHYMFKTTRINHYNELCLEMLDGEGRLYNAIDTDHNGMLLRVQDKKELKNYLKNCQINYT